MAKLNSTLEVIELTQEEFDRLPKYSCSIPTSPKIGFKWKCHRPYRSDGKPPDWYLAEAVDIRDLFPNMDPEKEVGIIWKRIKIGAE